LECKRKKEEESKNEKKVEEIHVVVISGGYRGWVQSAPSLFLPTTRFRS
jgi:hypothetical protein